MSNQKKVYLFNQNGGLLAESKRAKHKADNYINLKTFITDVESLAELKDIFIYNSEGGIMIVIEDQNTKIKWVGEATIISVPNETFNEFKLYDIQIAVEFLKEQDEIA